MDDARRNAHRREHTDAADAEQQFLTDAHAIVAAVQPRRQLAILGLIALDVRVEQQQRVPPDGQLPDARAIVPVRVSIDTMTGAPSSTAGSIGSTPAVDVEVFLVLPAVAVEALREIALVVVQTDADERNPEVGRALDVIAGEDAEAAGVDRQRLVQPELRREIRHRPRPAARRRGARPRYAWR